MRCRCFHPHECDNKLTPLIIERGFEKGKLQVTKIKKYDRNVVDIELPTCITFYELLSLLNPLAKDKTQKKNTLRDDSRRLREFPERIMQCKQNPCCSRSSVQLRARTGLRPDACALIPFPRPRPSGDSEIINSSYRRQFIQLTVSCCVLKVFLKQVTLTQDNITYTTKYQTKGSIVEPNLRITQQYIY